MWFLFPVLWFRRSPKSTALQHRQMGDHDSDRMEALVKTLRARKPLAGGKVKTLDSALVVYRNCDLKSSAISVPGATEIQLGSMSLVDGREWVEVTLPSGHRGYAIGPNVRSHCA